MSLILKENFVRGLFPPTHQREQRSRNFGSGNNTRTVQVASLSALLSVPGVPRHKESHHDYRFEASAMPIRLSYDSLDEMPELERRYTISELLRIAEQQTDRAKQAMEEGEPGGAERFQQWSHTLSALRIMKERGLPESLKD
jgi:hypothetical protein